MTVFIMVVVIVSVCVNIDDDDEIPYCTSWPRGAKAEYTCISEVKLK